MQMQISSLILNTQKILKRKKNLTIKGRQERDVKGDKISWMKEGSDFMFLSTGREALSIFTPPSYLAKLES